MMIAPPTLVYARKCKRGRVEIGHERFQNSYSVMGRQPDFFKLDYKGFKGGRRSSTP